MICLAGRVRRVEVSGEWGVSGVRGVVGVVGVEGISVILLRFDLVIRL